MLDLTQVKTGAYEPLPSGTYSVYADNAEYKKTKAGDDALNVTLKVNGREYGGRLIFKLFNIFNKNEKAQQIGLSELKSMLIAGGIKEADLVFKTREDLISKILNLNPFDIVLAVEQRDGFAPQNTVKRFMEGTVINDSLTVPKKINVDEIPF
jgi:hypothetical protein